MTKKSAEGLPSDSRAEAAVLGCLMLGDSSREYIPSVCTVLSPGDFYHARNQAVFAAIVKLYDQGISTDIVTVADQLSKVGDLDAAGGRTHLAECCEDVYSPVMVTEYAQIVKDKSKLRAAIQILGDGYQRAMKGLGTSEDIITGTMSRLDRIGASTRNKPVLLVDKIDEILQPAEGVKTGFPDIDHPMICLENGSLYVLGGFPGMGKTALAYDIARNVFKSGGRPLVFSVEMTTKQSAQRIASAETGIPIRTFRDGLLSIRQRERAAQALARCAIEFVESKMTPITPRNIEAITRECRRQTPAVGLVIIDYLQLIKPSSFTGNRNLDVGQMARDFKAMAMELGVPVLLLSQLRRIESVREPLLSDLRDSGEIEQHADSVIFVHRTVEQPDMADVIFAKMRMSEANLRVSLRLHKPWSTFAPAFEVDAPLQGSLV